MLSQVQEYTIQSGFRILKTSKNPNADRVMVLNIKDPLVKETSHVVVSISEFSAEGKPFFGEAIFYVDDIAPYNGGFLVRIEVLTSITDLILTYKVFYTAFTAK